MGFPVNEVILELEGTKQLFWTHYFFVSCFASSFDVDLYRKQLRVIKACKNTSNKLISILSEGLKELNCVWKCES